MAKVATRTDGKTYVMPKIEVFIQKGEGAPAGSYSYTYTGYQDNKKTVWSFLRSFIVGVIGFCVATVLFAVPVAITSVILVNTMTSQGVLTIRTQDVPSNGFDPYQAPTAPPPVVPAD